MSFMLTAEVLDGLGLRSGGSPARFSLQKPGEPARGVTLAPVRAFDYLSRMQPDFPWFVYALPRRRTGPLYLRRRGEDHYVTTLDHGPVAYVGYNLTRGSTVPEARKVSRLASARHRAAARTSTATSNPSSCRRRASV